MKYRNIKLQIYDTNPYKLISYIPLIHKLLPYLAWKFNKDYIRKRIKDAPGGGLRVVENEGRTIGFLSWLQEGKDEAYLWLCCVVPEFQGQGIMSMLLDGLLGDLCQQGYRKFSTKVKKDNNQVVVALLKRGFVVDNLYRDETGLGVLRLVKETK